ncbi:MAG: RNA 2',3'-cyclic phosphodiesterase [Clostridia bacterium]|nr:RNA 2',3'-cyclic phosphodiesterase [Clostridia bacterium]MDR3644361.1 RNA 2',3'-cyclic phosphodiesterase [Clostridia bacterium]
MRLFIAVRLPVELQRALGEASRALACQCSSGDFSREENYHITLAFLGERQGAQLAPLQAAMDAAASRASAFDFEIGGLGCFRREGGLVLWVGVPRGAQQLTQLYRLLCVSLAPCGFTPEDRVYTPHLTLARRALPEAGFERLAAEAAVPPLRARAGALSLMKSERINGRLVYTEIYSSILKEG